MAKKESNKYAENPYNARDYVFAWLLVGGNLNEHLEFEEWVRGIEFDGMKLSRMNVREILGEFYQCNNVGADELALMALDYKYRRVRSNILSDMRAHINYEKYNKDCENGDN